MIKTLALGAAAVALSTLITAEIVFAQTSPSPSTSSSPTASPSSSSVSTTVPGGAPSTGRG